MGIGDTPTHTYIDETSRLSINSHIHHRNPGWPPRVATRLTHHHNKLHHEVLATRRAGVVVLSLNTHVSTRRSRCDRFPYT